MIELQSFHLTPNGQVQSVTPDSPPSVIPDPAESSDTQAEVGSPQTEGGNEGTMTQQPSVAALRSVSAHAGHAPSLSSPMLANAKCSGYFLDQASLHLYVLSLSDPGPLTRVPQMPWMESFLRNGLRTGKIVCPNRKCGAKLGNYDWAGVRCGCTEWITPASVDPVLISLLLG